MQGEMFKVAKVAKSWSAATAYERVLVELEREVGDVCYLYGSPGAVEEMARDGVFDAYAGPGGVWQQRGKPRDSEKWLRVWDRPRMGDGTRGAQRKRKRKLNAEGAGWMIDEGPAAGVWGHRGARAWSPVPHVLTGRVGGRARAFGPSLTWAEWLPRGGRLELPTLADVVYVCAWPWVTSWLGTATGRVVVDLAGTGDAREGVALDWLLEVGDPVAEPLARFWEGRRRRQGVPAAKRRAADLAEALDVWRAAEVHRDAARAAGLELADELALKRRLAELDAAAEELPTLGREVGELRRELAELGDGPRAAAEVWEQAGLVAVMKPERPDFMRVSVRGVAELVGLTGSHEGLSIDITHRTHHPSVGFAGQGDARSQARLVLVGGKFDRRTCEREDAPDVDNTSERGARNGQDEGADGHAGPEAEE